MLNSKSSYFLQAAIPLYVLKLVISDCLTFALGVGMCYTTFLCLMVALKSISGSLFT